MLLYGCIQGESELKKKKLDKGRGWRGNVTSEGIKYAKKLGEEGSDLRHGLTG